MPWQLGETETSVTKRAEPRQPPIWRINDYGFRNDAAYLNNPTHEGYRVSQRARKRLEEVFGWVKTVGGGRKLRYCGVARNRLWVELTLAGYNLVRLARLKAVAA